MRLADLRAHDALPHDKGQHEHQSRANIKGGNLNYMTRRMLGIACAKAHTNAHESHDMAGTGWLCNNIHDRNAEATLDPPSFRGWNLRAFF
jgi:hypothetical protein